MTPKDFLSKAVAAAREAEHPWPEYAACEAALESAWGESGLCKRANNLFGQKQGFSTQGAEIIHIPTREYINHEWITVDAAWPCFPSWTESFRARMRLLRGKGAYNKALAATTGEEFVTEVSKVWATDPKRGDKVLAIYHAHFSATAAVDPSSPHL